MNLHHDTGIFSEAVRASSQHFNIREEFIEKDYWISLVLKRIAQSKHFNAVVFKGGTSLSKGFGLIDRFSEDVDLAVIDTKNKTGNQIKTIIRSLEKESTKELSESVTKGITSKGSRFRKSVYLYPGINPKNSNNKLIVEINSFANPFPHQLQTIKSMIYDFLEESSNLEFIQKYELEPFKLNLLNKEQTLVEKMVSLIRFSFDKSPVDSISSKIRHFYDLHFLLKDEECSTYIHSDEFSKQFNTILEHDKKIFDVPRGWQEKELKESPLIKDFDSIWDKLKNIYKFELSALAYKQIPDEKSIRRSFKQLTLLIK